MGRYYKQTTESYHSSKIHSMVDGTENGRAVGARQAGILAWGQYDETPQTA